jgi:hypothetical protein
MHTRHAWVIRRAIGLFVAVGLLFSTASYCREQTNVAVRHVWDILLDSLKKSLPVEGENRGAPETVA